MKTLDLFIAVITMSSLSLSGQHQHHHSANEHMHQHSFEELVKRFEDPTRDSWQKPNQVIALLGKIEGKTIMDIGAGTGYFSFRLAEKGAKVFAADVDDDFQNFIASKKKELGYTDDQVSLKKIPYDSPEIAPATIDVVIIVNTYHHIENRVPYFREVLEGLTQQGMLVVVDFKKQQFDQQVPGPPLEMRISSEQIKEELNQSGFDSFHIEDELLPYQYVLRAYKQEE
jgi:2-polyprenyl-3-methyl-5-hydroxy-6-metoxy-1,4-benzoquinol methylase